MSEKRLVCFKDLSIWLKIPIIFAYIIGVLYSLVFFISFTFGVLEG